MKIETLGIPALSALILAIPAAAQAERVAFVGCPVMRDMALPSYPCWLARDGDKLYYLGLQTDTIPPVPFYSPQLLHKVLVEADTVDGPQVCGGIATKNARASVLPELAPECDELLPQGDIVAPPMIKPSAPYRKGQRLAVGAPPAASFGLRAPPPPPPPYVQKRFKLDFGFGEDFIYLDDSFAIAQAAWYLQGIKGKSITLEVPWSRVNLTNGQVVTESAEVVERRAKRIQGILEEWAVPADQIKIVAAPEPTTGDRILTLVVDP